MNHINSIRLPYLDVYSVNRRQVRVYFAPETSYKYLLSLHFIQGVPFNYGLPVRNTRNARAQKFVPPHDFSASFNRNVV
jgi:hypothetical protein